MSSSSTSHLIAGAIGLAFGAAGGATLVVLARPTPATVAEPGAREQGSEELLASAVQDVATEIRELRESRAVEPVTRTQAVERVPVESPGIERAIDRSIERPIERLERAIEKLAEALQRTDVPASRALRSPQPAPVGPQPKNVALLVELRGVPEEERARPYYFWTCGQVVDRFGTPDEVQAGAENLWLNYHTIELQRGEDGDRADVGFSFINGALIQIEAD